MSIARFSRIDSTAEEADFALDNFIGLLEERSFALSAEGLEELVAWREREQWTIDNGRWTIFYGL